jgi:hypothetical protein
MRTFFPRIFYDIHKSEEMKTWLKSRIYNKLLKIKITQWFKQIDLTEIHIGSNLPKVPVYTVYNAPPLLPGP